MKSCLQLILAIIVGLSAVVGLIVVTIFVLISRPNPPARPTPISTATLQLPAPTMAVQQVLATPTQKLAPTVIPTPTPLPSATPTFVPTSIPTIPPPSNTPEPVQIVDIQPTVTPTPRITVQVFLPALVVAPTPNTFATQEAHSAIAVATQEAQQAIVASATRDAWAQTPPIGLWCASNDTRGVCVGEFRYVDNFDFYEAPDGTRYVAFLVGVKNISSSSISVNPYDITLVMDDGATNGLAFGSYSYWDVPLDAVTVASGDTALGGVLFIAFDDSAPARIIYRGGFWESEIVINLADPPQ